MKQSSRTWQGLACVPSLSLLMALGPTVLDAADSPQFRGPNRDGIYPEARLARSWPDGGPPLLWSASGLGESYASVSVADDRIFTTGKTGETGIVHALGVDGRRLWATSYGTEHHGNGYPGTRTTPTYAAGSIYVLSSSGDAVALDAASGRILWKVDVLERFGGENVTWGLAESPLVDGTRVVFTPGGPDASLVALDTATGATVWTSKGLSESAAYCSPRIWETGAHRQIVTMTAGHLVGLDPERGDVLWRTPMPAGYDIHANSPVFDGDVVYVSRHIEGSDALRLAPDGRSVTPVWNQPALDVHHGGLVLVSGRLYGASLGKSWHALDAASGEVLASIPELGRSSLVYADGLLYAYVESGEVLLVDPDPDSFGVISGFTVTAGDGQHWSHLVVSDRVLYVRHGDALLAYDVAAVD
jgi:outer membrane protein assembly factor BamB